tara:strand:- start:1579 stop:2535 length:957 start_codon:yes stop_codon:yes gene_type:complete
MTNYKDSQEIEESYEVSVVLMPTYINGLKEAAIAFNASHEEYLVALGDLAQGIYQFVNTGEIPNFTTALAKITFKHSKKCIIQSAEKFKKNIKNSRKGAETKKTKAEQLNTVKPEATEVADKPKPDNQTVSNSHQLKTQKAHKPQQVQKKQQLTTQEKQKAQISKIVSKLNWNTTAGLELSDEDKRKIVAIRLNNKKIHRDQREYTQSALNLSLPQIKLSLDNGIPIKELLEAWEGNGWIKWMHAWYAKEIASDIKAQSQTAKNLKSVKFNEAKQKNNDWENIDLDGEDLTGVMAILEGGELERQNPLHKELEKKYEK